VRKDGENSELAPVFWDDNYFELMPGEQREVAVVYPRKLLGGAASRIMVDGWNVAPER
jgi:exo-1,4-beta-D-glucosaminidase